MRPRLYPLAALAGAGLTAAAYWPGLMTWDSVRQYTEALSGEITDWHPPVMAALWRLIARVQRGPAPMLLLQLLLYWGGLTLLARAAARRERPGLGWAMLACGWWPLALAFTGMILKDCLMAGALLVAAGLIAGEPGRAGRLAAVATLLFAATLRFNAFLACLPFAVALAPPGWRATGPRLAACAGAALLVLLAAMPLANRATGAQPSGVALSQVIFDLGGITAQSGVDAFPDELETRTPVDDNRRCYRADKWDSYSDWVAPECPVGFSAWEEQVDERDIRPYPFWLAAIAHHPFAYAAHRLHHFALNTRVLPLPDTVERPVPREGPPNEWGYRTTGNPAHRLLDAAALATAHTPLGWPIVPIAVALGAALAGAGLPSARLSVPLALSGALYGLGYLVLSVASELRYHLWTQLAALLAAAIVASDWRAGARPARWRRRAAAALPAAAVLAGVAGRLA